MNEMRLSPDDPRLTAYALGELDGDERAAVEAALRHDPSARAAVEGIRATAAQIESALAGELDEETGAARQPAGDRLDFPTARPRRPGMGRILRVPYSYFVIGGLAA